MKLTILLIFIFTVSVSAAGFSQNKINLEVKKSAIADAISKIEGQTSYRFLYNENLEEIHKKVSVKFEDADIREALTQLFKDSGLSYQILDNQLIVIQGTNAGAADIVIKGKVVSTKGEPLIGVSVKIKGTTRGVSTDMNGGFTLSAPADATLVISYLGYKQKEYKLHGDKNVVITLQESSNELNEVVVIGYGTVQRRDLTGSVSSVNAKQLKDIPVNSTAEALAGRLAGVQITQSEGSPDASAQIRVRGGGSITQDNSPLYVVDGIQVENALSNLAPQDIESIDVLKDASATAIYGARGANGVVIITTKGGREMKPTVAYNGLVGFRNLARELDVMKPYDYVMYQYERSRSSSDDRTTFQNTYGTFEDLQLYKNAPFVDWQDQMFGRNALMQTHNLSLTGGTKDTRYNLSVTSNTEDGIMLGSDFDRKLVNFKFDQNITNKLKAGFVVRYNSTVVDGAGTANSGSSATNRLRHSVRYRPLLMGGQNLLDYDPDYADQTNSNSLSLQNPILLNQAEYRKNNNNIANFSGSVSYDINKFVTVKTTVGYELTNNRQNAFNDTITSVARQNSNQPTASVTFINRGSLNNSNVVSFSTNKSGWNFSKNNKLDVLVGQEIYQTNYKTLTNESHNFPVGITAERALGSLNLGTPIPTTSEEYKEHLLSFFGRANYSYLDRYLFTATMRADGSSKFAKGNKWGYFPSASFAWRLSDEKFFKKLNISALNDLKLRVSYGEAGNNRIDNFLYMTQFVSNPESNKYYSINDKIVTVFASDALANAFLKWETTVAKNVGFDMGLLNNRIQLSADFYRNSTNDNLVDVPIPSSTGYKKQLQNVGKTENNGVEIQLNSNIIQSKSFSWNANFNISYNKNKIKSLGQFQNSYLVSSEWGGSNQPFDYIVRVGEPVGAIWGLETDGYYKIDDFDYNNGTYTLRSGVANNRSITSVDPQPGGLKFRDISGPNGAPDGIVDDNDRTIIGNTQPKFFGGLNQQFSYKNFDLSVFVNFQLGNDVLNANKLEFTSGYTINANMLSMMNNRWRNVNDQGQVVTDPTALAALNQNATLWSPLKTASSFYVHSWAVEDGSFLRVNNITLGYTLPQKFLNRIKISRLRLYGTVNNLAIITNYSGYDPEVNTRRSTPLTPGVDYSAYPRSRAFIFGVNLSL